jgi:hypothetical protein
MDSYNDCLRDQWIVDNLAKGMNVCEECFHPFYGSTNCPNCGSEYIFSPSDNAIMREDCEEVIFNTIF